MMTRFCSILALTLFVAVVFTLSGCASSGATRDSEWHKCFDALQEGDKCEEDWAFIKRGPSAPDEPSIFDGNIEDGGYSFVNLMWATKDGTRIVAVADNKAAACGLASIVAEPMPHKMTSSALTSGCVEVAIAGSGGECSSYNTYEYRPENSSRTDFTDLRQCTVCECVKIE